MEKVGRYRNLSWLGLGAVQALIEHETFLWLVALFFMRYPKENRRKEKKKKLSEGAELVPHIWLCAP